jgi:hypothetical protein
VKNLLYVKCAGHWMIDELIDCGWIGLELWLIDHSGTRLIPRVMAALEPFIGTPMTDTNIHTLGSEIISILDLAHYDDEIEWKPKELCIFDDGSKVIQVLVRGEKQ